MMVPFSFQKSLKVIILVAIVAAIGAAAFTGWRYSTSNPASPEDQASQNQPDTLNDNSNEVNNQILRDIVGDSVKCELKDEGGNVINSNCTVDKVVGNYARGTMPLAYWIAVKVNNKWEVALTGNGIPTCAETDKNSLPKEIYGNCIEDSGQLRF